MQYYKLIDWLWYAFGLFIAMIFTYMLSEHFEMELWSTFLLGYTLGSLVPLFMVSFGDWVKENV